MLYSKMILKRSIKNYYILFISFFTFSLFFLGFFLQENSAGAGGFNGDFGHVWNNLLLFKNFGFWEGMDATAGIGENKYKSSRPPLLYILNAYFNPFNNSKESYIISIFFFSIVTYILFFLTLKKKYDQELDNSSVILISSIILLSPYFRTSSYWGLEENFGLFTSIISVFFFKKIQLKNFLNIKIDLFLLALFSSTAVYFGQNLIIIPLYFFLNIVLNAQIDISTKIQLFFYYIIFSIPFFYLIYIWGNVLPAVDSEVRGTLSKISFNHIGYSLTIIAFYIFPFLFLKEKNILEILLEKFKSYKIIFILLFFIVGFYFIDIINPLEREPLGNGIVYKFFLLFFNNFAISKYFLYSSFIISAIVILLYVDDNRDYILISYLLLSSTIIAPLYQEYFDPILLIMLLLFFYTRIIFSLKRLLFVYSYFFIFFIVANFYYKSNLLLFFKS